jgi:hypothetical protein
MDVLEKFSQKMANSGHSTKFMKKILVMGITKYVRKLKASQLDQNDKDFKPLHQHSGTSVLRFKKKMMARQNWFKDEKKDDKSVGRNVGFQRVGGKFAKGGVKLAKVENKRMENSSVMFVPSTKRSILINSLKEREQELSSITGFRVKYQEAGGIQLGKMFSTDLARDMPCGRVSCWPCKTSSEKESKNCKARSVLYETSCLICNPPKEESDNQMVSGQVEGNHNTATMLGGRVVADPSPHPKGRVGIYLGETSRSLHERAGEHVRDARKFHDKSHITKHWMNEHSDLMDIPPFKFRVVKVYRDALSRQLGEAVGIWMSGDTLLNSKNEYLSNCISRILRL